MRIRDPKAMRALAHPLRFDLIELLGIRGRATAAECARHLGTSQASCSFHLRQLAKYGFVEEAEPSDGDQRKRPWRLTDTHQSWSVEDHPVAARELERVFVEREAVRLLDFVAARGHLTADWRDASFLSGLNAPLTPAELTELHRAFAELLKPYEARAQGSARAPTDARWTRLFLSGAPLTTPEERRRADGDPDEPR
ncbi:ArsR/SmtB family transcription factor [Streptomyces avicenniae]|uniref:ArsR/SmtB family transcription factor n=1 Tax=Streptomyces avicenniae TaxID=500153 RepID=UPI00069944CE|nr:helix-turn-helix domain-containing protein [Streptomyces avicenniae]